MNILYLGQYRIKKKNKKLIIIEKIKGFVVGKYAKYNSSNYKVNKII